MTGQETINRHVLKGAALARALCDQPQKLFFLVGFLVLAADQLSKSLAREMLLGEPLPVEGLVRFRQVSNDGIILGIGAPPALSFVVPSVLMIAAVFLCWRYVQPNSRLLNTALALFVCGGLGNLIDRLLFGCVTDFIDISLPGGAFGITFNLADLSILAGTILFAVFVANLVMSTRDQCPHPGTP